MSRLDRFLVSHDWLSLWPDCVQEVMDREISDHCPLLLRFARQDWGPQPFRVINCWFQNWSLIQAFGRRAFVIKEKLKVLKARLKQWNKESFGDITIKRKEIVKEINDLDRRAQEIFLNTTELAKKKELEAEYWRLATLNESLLCQKARINWVKEGDANTKFFHGLLNWRRRTNSLFDLNIEGEWSENPMEIRSEVKKILCPEIQRG